jgi:ectoine hydroxylase-related dioxygenase (phytanoyl-CoA dioxygenase family)
LVSENQKLRREAAMSELEFTPEVDEASRFDAEGYLVIDKLIDAQTVAALAAAYDDLLARPREEMATDRELGGVTRQIMLPSLYHELFRDNPAITAAREIAKRLMGVPDPQIVYDMLIYKPPGHPAETPWHQDMAYRLQPFAPAGSPTEPKSILQFWVALDDVDVSTGCMHFIPGVHTRPLLPHYVASGDLDDQGRLLAVVAPEQELDLNAAVACPLSAGGATVHSYGTPHYTPANTSATRHRRAYIFSLGDPSVPRKRDPNAAKRKGAV